MNILAIGDVVGQRAVEYLKGKLWSMRSRLGADLVIANGENATEIHGLSRSDAQGLLDSGVDLITLGNHSFSCSNLYGFLDENPNKIIRPVNYPASCPGYGHTILNINGYRVLCINAQGQAFMDTLRSPFDAIEAVLDREAGNYDISVLDIHAEATSEKYAVARCFDGKINVIFGTHTHVPTADLQILPGGSAYVTDLGMTGPVNGILGTDTSAILRRIREHMPSKFVPADGDIQAQAVLFELDGSKVTSVKRVLF